MGCYQEGDRLIVARLLLGLAVISLIILPPICRSQAYLVNVSIKGYDGEALLNITAANFSTSEKVRSGSKIELSEGKYVFRLFALNKTFEKELNLTENTTLTFNLLFTNSTENLSLIRHIIVYPSAQIEVYEILLITNSGDKNFEGDISVPIPDHKDLNIEESTLSFINANDEGNRITFIDIIVPANDSGRIAFSYSLKSNVFKISDSEKQRLLLLSAVPVEKYENLSYKGIQDFGGQKYRVFEGNTTKCYLVFGGGGKVKVNPVALAGIFLLATSVFFYLRSRSGGWEED